MNTPTELVDLTIFLERLRYLLKLQVTELDFDDIKENLKTFLKHKTNLRTMILKVLV